MFIRLFLAMGGMVLLAPATLGWFAASSLTAGVGVAVWLSRRGQVQQLFVKAEEPPVIKSVVSPILHAIAATTNRIVAMRALTVAEAVVLGILIGYLFANLISMQLHAEAIARAATIT